MKKFIILLIVFVCFKPSARSEEFSTVIELVKDDILITHPLELDQKFKKKIQIIRSKISPLQVNILFKYNLKAEECILWEESLVIIPGYYELRCEMIGTREECHNVWIEEHQQLEKTCKQFEEQIQMVFKKIIFDFSSATKLSANQREVFEVEESSVRELERDIIRVSEEILGLTFWQKKCEQKDCRFCALSELLAQK